MKDTRGYDSGDTKGIIHIRIGGALLLVLAIIAICVAGATIRLQPIGESDLPYHLDGILEARYADQIMVTGTLEPETGTSYSSTHTIHTPAYDAFVALSSLIVVEKPIAILQLLLAPISCLLVLGCYSLGRTISGNERVGLITALAIAFYGPLVFVTQGTWKEVLGIALIPLILIAFHNREDMRMRIISTILILLMPFIHHLVAIILLLIIAITSVASFLQARKSESICTRNVIDIIVTIIASGELISYYILVRFDRLEYLTPENGLYLFLVIVILLSLGVYYVGSRCLSYHWRRAIWLSASSMVILLLTMSMISPIFTEDSTNVDMLSAPLMAILALAFMGIYGISLWTSSKDGSKTLYFAILAAPIALIFYAYLRAADLISHGIVARTLDFMDIGLFIGLGTFLAYELKGGRRWQSILIVTLISILLIMTLPVAIDPEKYLETRNDVSEFEVDGIEWASELESYSDIQTDRHYSAVARNMFDLTEDYSIIRRFVNDIPFPSETILIASERWVTIGTSDHPFGWIQIEQEELDQTLEESNTIYIGGPRDLSIIIFVSP